MGNASESVPAAWSTTDEQFFRSTADLFPSRFLRGSGALLATYDEHVSPAAPGPVSAAGLRQDTAALRRATA